MHFGWKQCRDGLGQITHHVLGLAWQVLAQAYNSGQSNIIPIITPFDVAERVSPRDIVRLWRLSSAQHLPLRPRRGFLQHLGI